MIRYDDENKGHPSRLYILYGLFLFCMALFFLVLYDAQVKNVETYRKQSMSKIAADEPVEASRGVITDRNGKVLVKNRTIYTVTIDEKAFADTGERNAEILRLTEFALKQGIPYGDHLPISQTAPYTYTPDAVTSTQLTWFNKFLQDEGWTEESVTKEDMPPHFTAKATEKLGLSGETVSASQMFSILRTYYEIDDSYTDREARLIMGVLYELSLRKLSSYYVEPYTFAEDIDVSTISLLNDGQYKAAKVKTVSVREYTTPYAAHILGRIGKIQDYTDEMKEAGYQRDDLIGLEGVEKAFEEYLRGEDGVRSITTNEDGKITGEVYATEPKPGDTVALTIDLDLQAAAENALAAKIQELNKKDGYDARSGAVVVMEVGTGDILASASYPTYDPARYNEDYTELLEQPGNVFVNKAFQGTYPPGSTFKPLTAVAALESGAITPDTKIKTQGVYRRYSDYQPACWIWRASRRTHGTINVSEALTESCNYFFYEAGYLTGISKLVEFGTAFGLGQPTGVELPEKTGIMDGPDYRESVGQLYVGGDLLQISIGQGANLVTPLQLANYTATLVNGGDRYAAHLLKTVKSYDNSEVLYTYEPEILSTVSMSGSTLEAVKKGMGELVESGSVSAQFKDCIVSAGAKTGSAQTGLSTDNGMFIAFAPFDDPQIAIAISVERGGTGGAQAGIAVEIINEWFKDRAATGPTIVPENQLVP